MGKYSFAKTAVGDIFDRIADLRQGLKLSDNYSFPVLSAEKQTV